MNELLEYFLLKGKDICGTDVATDVCKRKVIYEPPNPVIYWADDAAL